MTEQNTEKTWTQVQPEAPKTEEYTGRRRTAEEPTSTTASQEETVQMDAAPTETQPLEQSQPVDTPVQPAEDTDFDHGVRDNTVDESTADFGAEEQNPKEETKA